MLSILSLLVACSPSPASIKLDGEAAMNAYSTDPIAVEHATVLADDGTALDPQPAVTWTVTPDTVAKLDGDKVVPLANGEATVTAAVGDIKSEYKVTVALPDAVAVSGYAAGDVFAAGESRQLTAKVMSGTTEVPGQTVVWASENPLVVGVDANGMAMALGEGTTNVTATAGTLVATVAVTVTPAVPATADAHK